MTSRIAGITFCLRFGDGFKTVEQLKKIVASQLDSCKRSDKSFWCDAEFFLGGGFEVAIEAHLKSCVLACLPGPNEERSLLKDLLALRKLLDGDVCQAQCKTLQKELANVRNLLVDVQGNNGPSALESGKLSDFSKKALKNI